jgi:hypothetical protein
MTLRKRALKNYRPMNQPVSFRLLAQDKLSDARNIIDNEGVQETRYGLKRYNATGLGGAIISQTFFKKSDGTSYRLAKVGDTIYEVANTGASTALETGLDATSKHRAVTFIDRHIIAVEDDGLFYFDGTDFSPLGQAAPSAATATIAAGGSLTDGSTYQAAISYYSSTTGFESNATSTGTVTATAANKTLALSSIPTTATNLSIDKIRIYIKNVTANSSFLFVADVNLGTTTYNITAMSTSTITPPTTNFPPEAGGAKYLAIFGDRLAYAGNSTFPNEVFVSKPYLPDAFDNADIPGAILVSGQGPITGLAVGFFDDSQLSPYLVIFKKNSITIYSELGGTPAQAILDENVGCVSADTIRIGNGLIYFLSDNGWRVIKRGTLVRKEQNMPYSLGNGDIDDIFTRTGWTFELNRDNFANFFSAYYGINSQYITFISEGQSEDIRKAYVYEERLGGFRVFDFKYNLTSACDGEDDNGNQAILLSDQAGFIYTYSISNPRRDEDGTLAQYSIPVSIKLSYIQPGDDSSSYNFKTMAVKAIGNDNPITIKAYPTYGLDILDERSYDFPNNADTFILDVSQLDVDVLGDDRIPVTVLCDISLTGETLLVVFEQDVIDGNIGLISAQVNLNKNGNWAV